MATQLITIAKIGGVAGDAVMRHLQRLHTLIEIGYSEGCRDCRQSGNSPLLKRFAESLRSNRYTPPVVFFAEYVDLWSMGDVFEQCLPQGHSINMVRLSQNEFEVFAYRLPDDGLLERKAKQLLRTKVIQKTARQEQRWLLTIVRDAVNAWREVVNDSALVIVRKAMGPLVSDSDILQTLEHVPQWISEGGN